MAASTGPRTSHNCRKADPLLLQGKSLGPSCRLKRRSDARGGRTGPTTGCTEYAQVPAPRASTPPELDLDQLGRAYLQLLGMSAQEAERFSQRVNWATTLVVPLPASANLKCGSRSVSWPVIVPTAPGTGSFWIIYRPISIRAGATWTF